MACTHLCFRKDSSGIFSPDVSIVPDGALQINHQTTINVRLHNDTHDRNGAGSVAIYWAPIRDDDTLCAPTLLSVIGQANPTATAIIQRDSYFQFQYTWTPSSYVVGDPSDPFDLAIFVQAIGATVLGPDGCPGWWHRGNFDPAESFNAAQRFPFLM